MTSRHAPRVTQTLDRLYAEAGRQNAALFGHYVWQLPRYLLGRGFAWNEQKTAFYDNKFIAIDRQQGAFIYQMLLATKARQLVEYGTSFGISTLFLAAAARENGGRVITTELVPEKIRRAKEHIAEAGLSQYVEVLEGDARQTLQQLLFDAIDFVLLDGFPTHTVAVLQALEPKLAKGCLLMTDNINTFKNSQKPFLDYVTNPANGYLSRTLPLKDGTQLTVRL